MLLRGWHVEGFGLLADFRVESLPDGLTVVLGPNEAGKTSLLAFLRGVLFGFPDRRKKERQYPPLRGGRHGGRLFLEADGSSWTVERFSTPSHLLITRPDGATGTEADLRRLLGGVDAELHRNVFAFSLSELQEFESLNVEGVRDRIFAAGVVGAGNSARTALKALAEKRAEIGRKRGECRVNDLRRRLDEIDRSLLEARGRSARHPELRLDAEKADEERGRIGRELSSARHEMSRLDALLSAWPDWVEAAQARRELDSLPPTPDLSEDIGGRLESSLAGLQADGRLLDERRLALAALEEQVDGLVPDPLLSEVAPEARRLASQAASVRAWRKRLGDLRPQHLALQRQAEEEAARLGPGWTSATVRAFDASIPASQEIADWGKRLREADKIASGAEDRESQLASSAREIADELRRRQESLELHSSLPSVEEIASLDSGVRRLRAVLAQLAPLKVEIAFAGKRIADLEHELDDARSGSAARENEHREREAALRSAPELPPPDDLAKGERALRELRAGLADLTTAQSEHRLAAQRADEVARRANEAEIEATSREREVERRSDALAKAPPLPDASTLAEKEGAFRELRRRLQALSASRAELRTMEQRISDLKRAARHPVSPARTPALRRSLLAAAAVLLVIGIVLAAVGQAVAAGVAAAAAIAAAIWAISTGAGAPGAPDDSFVDLAALERDSNELRNRIQASESAARPLAARLGCPTLPDLVELEASADELATQLRASQERDREATAIGLLRTEAERARDLAERLRSEADSRRTEADAAPARRVVDLEERLLALAGPLGFAQLPSAIALEERVGEYQDLARRRRERDAETKAVSNLAVAASHSRELVARLEKRLAALRAEAEENVAKPLSTAEETALEIARSLGFPTCPEAPELEEKGRRVEGLLHARQEHDREISTLEELRRRLRSAEESLSAAADTSASSRGSREALAAEWASWKETHGCPAALSPETAQQFFAKVEQVREKLAQLDALAGEATELDAEIGVFSSAVESLRQRAGLPRPNAPRPAEDQVEELRDRVNVDTQTRADLARLERDVEAAREALTLAQQKVDGAERSLAALLEEAGAVDVRDCRARIATGRRRIEIERRLGDAEHRLRCRLGVGQQAEEVRRELASGNRPEWEAAKQRCKALLASSQPAYEEAVRRHQTAVEGLAALERESDVVVLASEREGVISEIVDAIGEWRLLAIADALVQGTLRRYEEERQPAVLTRAAAIFSRITAARYARLASREDGIDVIAAEGGRLDAAALSRGAAEQLYLCLRLALAGEFRRYAVPLPLVMDDVLVNFDQGRARLAAEVLLEATAEHQILLFTCHPETVELLTSLSPGLRVVLIHRESPTVRPARALQDEPRSQGTYSVPGPRQVVTPSVADLSEAVLSAIRAAGKPLSRAEILEITGMPESSWNGIVQGLREGGRIVPHGRKRGTTWGLPDSAPPSPGADWGES